MGELELEKSGQLARTGKRARKLVEGELEIGRADARRDMQHYCFCFLRAAFHEQLFFVALRKQTTFSFTGDFIKKRS
jgi:hypothetical protein